MINVLITGDFCPIGRVAPLVENGRCDDIFGPLLPKIRSADLAITNLEVPLTESVGAIRKTGPSLKSSAEVMNVLKSAGFDLLTLANNHIMDYGERGLSDTLDLARSSGISTVGAEMSLMQARKPFFYQKDGTRLAILNFAENEWSTTHGREAGANPLDPVMNFNQISKAREEADKIIIIVHGGHEMYELPSPRIKGLFRYYIDCGADIVVNHHPHCISGYEKYKKGIIFYSVGNFVFDNYPGVDALWNTGLALSINLDEDNIEFSILPFNQCGPFPGIAEKTRDEEQMIFSRLEKLNEIIGNDEELELHFNKFVKKKMQQYLNYIEPFANKYFFALKRRGLIPSLWSKLGRMKLLNLVRCESHRDVLLYILTKATSVDNKEVN